INAMGISKALMEKINVKYIRRVTPI
ncbi:MAG: hypothetical protein RLZZ537_1464, partial [Pseudomonadota bacterium]